MKQTATRSLIVPLSILLCLLLVACGTAETADTPPTQPPPAPATESAAIPTATLPTAPEPAEPTAAPADGEAAATEASPPTPASPATAEPQPLVTSGRNDNGTFFRGAPDAPVTLVDYSDFL